MKLERPNRNPKNSKWIVKWVWVNMKWIGNMWYFSFYFIGKISFVYRIKRYENQAN